MRLKAIRAGVGLSALRQAVAGGLPMAGAPATIPSEDVRMTEQERFRAHSSTSAREWVWEQLNEEGFQIAGELIDLILKTERELGIHTRDLDEIATLIVDEFRMRGIEGKPQRDRHTAREGGAPVGGRVPRLRRHSPAPEVDRLS